MSTLRQVLFNVSTLGLILLIECYAAQAATPAVTDAGQPKTLPQDSIVSSIKQSLNQDVDHDVVRGHFELGDPPNVRRYYCLISTKTGRREPNGVLGELDSRPNGLIAVKNSSVSMYSCTKAEQAGMLVTAGYIFNGAPVSTAASAAEVPQPVDAPKPPVAIPATVAAPVAAASAAPVASRRDGVALSPTQIDIGGVRLGMSPDEVRAVLKLKRLLDYTESAETLSYLDSAKGVMHQVANGRFVNIIAAWTPSPSAAAGDNYQVDGESFQVMFTPVPGKERVMGIVHSVGYSPTNAVREVALEAGLVRKYGGFDPNELPPSPTWRIQSDGYVQAGDPCNRRGTLGGLGALSGTTMAPENLALKRGAANLKSMIERCGVAIVTEDHFTVNGGALRDDRLVTRFTMTAYSPDIALEGAKTATLLIQAAGGVATKSEESRAKEQAPSL
ncbi:MAG: hypothetical protein ABJC66_15510 [Gammaproteobacteria bacterium]